MVRPELRFSFGPTPDFPSAASRHIVVQHKEQREVHRFSFELGVCTQGRFSIMTDPRGKKIADQHEHQTIGIGNQRLWNPSGNDLGVAPERHMLRPVVAVFHGWREIQGRHVWHAVGFPGVGTRSDGTLFPGRHFFVLLHL